MRVVIAEDEMLERKAMRKFLEEQFQDIEIVGEAVNGRKAIELAEELQPDLMLMDIKMPGIDGLEAMEIICQSQPAIKFIVVSAYDSFHYAKQAMKLGVKEYILKPSNKEETIRAILNVRKEIAGEKQMNENRKSLFLTKIMQGEDVSSLQQSLFPEMKSGFFIVMNQFTSLPNDFLQKDKVALYISSDQLDNAAVLTKIRNLQLQLGANVFIGIGHPSTRVEDLTNSYYEAKQALFHLVEAGKKKYGFPPLRKISPDLTPFYQALKEGDDDRVWVLFEEIADQLDVECYFKIKQLVEEKDCTFPDIPADQLTTVANWREFVEMVCFEIREYYQSKNKIDRAKQYISENYQRALTLEDVAYEIELSPNYFSQLFREETGYTFSDYVTEVRIQTAKDLLRENHASLKEISSHIGYRDPNYFSRVFKKQVGLSPKQYQNQIIKK